MVDRWWARWENSGTEGREIVCTKVVALSACDPAPWLSQTPTRRAMSANIRKEDAIRWYLFVLDFLLNSTTFVVWFRRKSGSS